MKGTHNSGSVSSQILLISISVPLHIHRVRKNAPYTVQIWKKPDGNGKIARGALDISITSKRNQE